MKRSIITILMMLLSLNAFCSGSAQVDDSQAPYDSQALYSYQTPLYKAVFDNDIEAVRFYVKFGQIGDRDQLCLDPFETYVWFRVATPLMLAARKGYLEIMHLLIEGGVSLNKLDSDNRRNALFIAIVHEQSEAALMLIEAGADINVNNSFMDVSIIEAASYDLQDVVLKLIEVGADVNALNYGGWSSLMHFSRSERPEMLGALIEAGADVDVISDRPGFGRTNALLLAALNRHLVNILIFIEAGADLNVQNEHGYTALMRAVSQNNIEMARALLEGGADFRLKDKNGKDAINNAYNEGFTEMVDLIAGYYPTSKK